MKIYKNIRTFWTKKCKKIYFLIIHAYRFSSFSIKKKKKLFYLSSFTHPFFLSNSFFFFFKPIGSGQNFTNSLEKFRILPLLSKPMYWKVFWMKWIWRKWTNMNPSSLTHYIYDECYVRKKVDGCVSDYSSLKHHFSMTPSKCDWFNDGNTPEQINDIIGRIFLALLVFYLF